MHHTVSARRRRVLDYEGIFNALAETAVAFAHGSDTLEVTAGPHCVVYVLRFTARVFRCVCVCVWAGHSHDPVIAAAWG